MVPDKGVDRVLRAAQIVLRQHVNAHFVMVGDGYKIEDYRQMAESLGISGNVTWTGLLENPTRDGIFAAADLLCQVSQWEEAFGLTIAEAMTAGVPVIATRVGGIPEIIEDGKTGFLIGRDDVLALAARVDELLANEPLRRSMGKHASDCARARFDLNRMVEQYGRHLGALGGYCSSGTLLYVVGITPNKIGGVETFLRELAISMDKCGWRLVLCFVAKPTQLVREFLNLPNVDLEVFSSVPKAYFHRIRTLAFLLRRYKPKVFVYAFDGILRFYPWLARVGGVKDIYYNDRSSRTTVKSRALWKRAVARIITKPVRGVVAISRYVREAAAAEGFIPAKRVRVIINGVDLAKPLLHGNPEDPFRRYFRIPDERKIVLKVSWMIPEKGIDKALAVAKIVIDRFRDVQFVMVGDGPSRYGYEKLATDLGISSHVTWTGYLDSPSDAGAFGVADILLQMSQWEEAFGFVIAEAMSYGVPVVATRVGGIPEVVEDGVNGYLVDRTDIMGAAEKLVQLLQDDELRQRFKAESRRLATERFDVRRMASEYLRSFGIQ